MEEPNNPTTLNGTDIGQQNKNAQENKVRNNVSGSFQIFKPAILMVTDEIKRKNKRSGH